MPVKQSASKGEFTAALGLNLQNKDDEQRLTTMWVCAWEAIRPPPVPPAQPYIIPINGRERLIIRQKEVTSYWVAHFETSSRSILREEYATNMNIVRPYKWAHLSPARIEAAMRDIWTNGQPVPKFFYDRGHSEDPRVFNWVLKWLLWHVCRYRDWRNIKARNSKGGASAGKANAPSSGEFDGRHSPFGCSWLTG